MPRCPAVARRTAPAGRLPRPAGHLHRAGAAHPARPGRGRARRRSRRSPTCSSRGRAATSTSASSPIENAIEGTVNVTLDTLAFDIDLLIQREVVLAVQHEPAGACPARRWPTSRTVVSIPRRHRPVPGVPAQASCPARDAAAANSTAEAARSVVDDRPTGSAAAIGTAPGRRDLRPRRARRRHRGPPREPDPLRARRPATAIPAPTGHDKTSIVVFQRADAPGSLLGILQEFAARAHQPDQAASRGRPSGASATTASSSTSRATSPTRSSPTACATCRPKQADVKFLGLVPGGRRPRRPCAETPTLPPRRRPLARRDPRPHRFHLITRPRLRRWSPVSARAVRPRTSPPRG